MNRPVESNYFKAFRELVSKREDACRWQYEFKDCATVTYPASSSDVGDLVVFDDGHELTLGIGKIYHTHFNPEFGPSFDRTKTTVVEHIASEAMAFIDEVLAGQKVFWICFKEGVPFSAGAMPMEEVEEIPDDAVCYVWSGRYER